MYCPTAQTPAAAPRQACYLRPALYHYAPAPYARRHPRPAGRSMAAALAGKTPAVRAAWLAANYARHVAGRPLLWPQG